ncbi:acetate--CoA ligase family protein [uncultured Desulfosarcina sp.]|uniref:acetate--CoA ligase family protein n=1 Tax=uncultured Desulfosarcina sp. TaxID=218289 RepID=UPI0029C923AC|nr:acetate--CoA ligase family protein [uncultured Desulfosarcina sp.]
MEGLDALFNPESVAVVGASSTPGKVGHDIFVNILKGGYKGTLYPVNPRAKSIASVRAYADIQDIPDSIELAIIILPPRLAEPAIKQAIEKGVKAIVIVSAGFKEVGGEGLEIEKRIVAMCREAGVRVVGPNCLGVINPNADVRLNASFSSRMPKAGNISFISQSGALCTAVLDFAADKEFGFSKFVSIGNKADVDELDLLRYFHADPETEVIMLYIEELQRGPEFIQAVKEITGGDRPTPVLAIKSGRTSAGAKAAASHTGSLAGSEAVYDALFTQSGIIRVESINELFDFGTAFAYKNESALGKMRRKVPLGNRLAIVTNAGGPGIVATDMTITSGLELATFSEETVDVLKSHLPETANFNNPVDVIGDAAQDRYENALWAVIRDEGVDGALVILTPQSMTNAIGTAEAIVRIAQRSHKPILCCFMGIIDVSAGVKYLQEHGVPVYRFPESAAKTFGALYRYSRWLNRQQLAPFPVKHDKEKARAIIAEAVEKGQTYMGEIGGTELLKCYGFNVLPTVLADSAEQAGTAAEEMGYPVVMKIVSPQIIHKSDAGGVMVGLNSREEAVEAFTTIVDNARKYSPDAEITGVLVQKLAPQGKEVILGMSRYPIFGPLIMFGFGGVFVEVFKDVAFRLAPLTRNGARNMVRSIRANKLLSGYRGAPKADIATIERMLVNLSDLVLDHPEIKELDINPLLVHPEGEGVTVADCRLILEEK